MTAPNLDAHELRYVDDPVGASEYSVLEPPQPKTLADVIDVIDRVLQLETVAEEAELAGARGAREWISGDIWQMLAQVVDALRSGTWTPGRMVGDPVERVRVLAEMMPGATRASDGPQVDIMNEELALAARALGEVKAGEEAA